jgi:hypothetical protein
MEDLFIASEFLRASAVSLCDRLSRFDDALVRGDEGFLSEGRALIQSDALSAGGVRELLHRQLERTPRFGAGAR